MKISQLLGLGATTDQKSVDFLENAMVKQAQPGFDYLKFKQSIEQLAGLKLDGPTSLKSAFATASTMGVTKRFPASICPSLPYDPRRGEETV
ncbi:MAG: hypothetical protein IPL92_00055 [Saprospiraceae bacterium]|nr:hypothetical protein [Candidatus Opimibacter iunctus]